MDDFIKQKITQLEAQLKQAQEDLKSDVEIFADKDKEVSQLKENINDLESKLTMANRCLEASLTKEKEQQELMLQLQLQLDRLILNNSALAKQDAAATADRNNKQHDDSGVSKMSSPSSVSSLSSSKTTAAAARPAAMPRAKTAPQSNSTTTVEEKGRGGGEEKKNTRAAAYSSPAQLTMEKFMQSFRARSQLLAETLEVCYVLAHDLAIFKT